MHRCARRLDRSALFRGGTVLILTEFLKSALICSTLVMLAAFGSWQGDSEAVAKQEFPVDIGPELTKPIYELSVSDDEQVQLTVHMNGLVRLQRVGQAIPEQDISDWKRELSTAVLSPDGETIVIALYDGSIGFVRLQKPDEVQTASVRHQESARALAISADGTLAASGGNDGIMIWDLKKRELLSWYDLGLPVRKIRFSPEGNRMAAVSGSGSVRILDVPDGRQVLEYTHSERVVDAAFAGSDGRVVSLDDNGTLVLRDLHRPNLSWVLKEQWPSAWGLSVSRDGRVAAVSGGWRHQIYLVSLDQGLSLGTLTGHRATPSYLWFSPKRERLYSAGYDGDVRVWDIRHKPEWQPESTSRPDEKGKLFPVEVPPG